MNSGLPSEYNLRLEHISHAVSRLKRDAPPNIILLGDRNAEKNPANTLCNFNVLNMGIAEDSLSRNAQGCMVKRLWQLPMAKPAHVILMAGFNDLQNGNSPLEVEQCILEVIHEIKKTVPSAEIHIASIPPTRDKYQKLMPAIALTNACLEELAEKENVPFVDLFSLLEDDEGVLAQNYTEDGYQLNDIGYDKINNMLEKHIQCGDSY